MKNNLFAKLFALALIPAVFAGMTGCSSAPTNAVAIDNTLDINAEFASTKNALEAQRNSQTDVLSPEKFSNAERSVKKAEAGLKDKDSSNDVRKNLQEARAWLGQASEFAAKSRNQLAVAIESRTQAAAVVDGRDTTLGAADQQLRNLAGRIEAGKSVESEDVLKLSNQYVESERARLTHAQLDPIETRLNQAKDLKAKKLAPVSYEAAHKDFEAAKETLQINPFDRSQFSERVKTAVLSSTTLLEVAKQTARANNKSTEELVIAKLNRDKVAKGIVAQNTRLKSEVGDLQGKAQATELMDKLKSQLPQDKAEILMNRDGQVVIRLKDLQFKTNSADLTPAAAVILSDVKSTLSEIHPKSMTINGHTDSTGSAKVNKALSESRAKSVATFLQNDAALKSADIKSEGFGAEQPLKNNKTKSGRAENRRVEITFETL